MRPLSQHRNMNLPTPRWLVDFRSETNEVIASKVVTAESLRQAQVMAMYAKETNLPGVEHHFVHPSPLKETL